MAGKVQIATNGFITEQLTGEPDFTFFNHRFSKHTHFAKETIKISPDNEKVVQTGDHVEFSIPANSGDIINGLSISFSIPDNLNVLNTDSAAVYVVDQFGISVFEYIDLYLGDQLIDRITPDDIHIHTTTRSPSTYNNTNAFLHGLRFNPTKYNASFDARFTPRFHYGTQNINGQFHRLLESNYTQGLTKRAIFNFMVELPFYFHDRPKYGFPLCSIQSQELKIRMKLRDGREVLFPVDNTSFDTSRPSSEWDYANDHKSNNFQLSDFKLNMDVIHLDKRERKTIKSLCKDLLIEQNQHNTFTMGSGVINEKYRLDLKNCVKELYFIVKKKYKPLTTEEINTLNALSNASKPDSIFTNNPTAIFQKPVPCIYMRQKYVTLTCDGLPILDDTTGSHQFLSACIPDIYHKQSPYESNLTMYSFALHPDNMEPSGDLNFTVIKDATIEVELSNDGAYANTTPSSSTAAYVVHVEKDVHIIAKSYNILRIKDGVGEILF
jgi:hypothetical protein